MYQIAIVEDEASIRAQLREYVRRYGEETGQQLSVQCFAGGEALLQDYDGRFDLILMDIEMKFMDGMMAAEEIRKVDTEVIIIFITNSPQYAIKGYAVDALDYVLKPVSYYAFSQRLGRAVERVARRARHFLQINAHGTAHKLDTSSIYWIENCGHDLVFHTAEGELTAPGSMTETEEKLAQDSYFRVNKGCLVNLEHVDRMDGEDAVVHGDRVPLARARRKAFLDALNDYINGAG